MYIKFQKIQKQKKSLDLVKQKFLELNKIEKTEEHIDSTILGSRMTLECVVSMVPRQKLTANGVNKPEQKV